MRLSSSDTVHFGDRLSCRDPMHRTANYLGALACLLLVPAALVLAQGSGGINAPSQRDKPYVILVSIDGFRWDYQSLYDTPALDRIAAAGVRAEALVPVFPTLTFPNHYSIATGLYPTNHGIVGNRFLDADRTRRFTLTDRAAVGDGSWYGGEPVWVIAERQGMVAAAFFFVGTEAEVRGIRPTHWRRYNEAIEGATRVDQILAWLRLPEAERPHVLTLYFEDVDTASHRHGVGSPLMIDAIERVDGYLIRLLDGIAALPHAGDVYTVIVSDHGQMNYRNAPPFVLADAVDLTGVRVEAHGSVAFLWFDTPDPVRAEAMCATINDRWQHGQAVVPGGAPQSWRLDNSPAWPDVIVQADAGYAVVTRPDDTTSSRGDHGWSPDERSMHGVFLAAGPRLPAGRRIGRIAAVDVYPLLLDILGLPAPDFVDGDAGMLVPLLESR